MKGFVKWLHKKIMHVDIDAVEQWVVVYYKEEDIVLGNLAMNKEDAALMAKKIEAEAKEQGISVLGIVREGDSKLVSLLPMQVLKGE